MIQKFETVYLNLLSETPAGDALQSLIERGARHLHTTYADRQSVTMGNKDVVFFNSPDIGQMAYDTEWGRGHFQVSRKPYICDRCDTQIPAKSRYMKRTDHTENTTWALCIECAVDNLFAPTTYDYAQSTNNKEEVLMETQEIQAVATQQPTQIQQTWLEPSVVIEQVKRVAQIREAVMKEGEHYGTIPGTQKPTLYKAGAEILGISFNMTPKFPVVECRMIENNHREYEITCVLYNRVSGAELGTGIGSCSTLESKYRWRNQERICPKCRKEAMIKGKEQYGGGWVCYVKKGGCGAKYKDGDQAIEGQQLTRIENPDIADMYNTVKKMAKKRAFVDATLTVTAASGMFTQDLEDITQFAKQYPLQKDSETTPANDIPTIEVKREPPDKTPIEKLRLLLQKLAEFQPHPYGNKLQAFEAVMAEDHPKITEQDLQKKIKIYQQSLELFLEEQREEDIFARGEVVDIA